MLAAVAGGYKLLLVDPPIDLQPRSPEEILRRAVSIGSPRPGDRLARAQALEMLGRTDQAQSELASLASDYPTWPPPHYALADLYTREHLHSAAAGELRLAQSCDDGQE